MSFIKDEEKRLLLDRYVDIEWPDDVTDLRCVHCQQVAIHHHVSNCQHIFCTDCKTVLSDGGQCKCPQCQEYVTQLDVNFDVEIKIHQLKIFCPNKKFGCKYEEQLRKIPTHLMTCVYTREDALPDTMDTVAKQLSNINATIGELKEGIKEVKDKVVVKFNQIERKSDEMDSKPNAMTTGMSTSETPSEDTNVAMELIPKKCTADSERKLSLEPMDNGTMERVRYAEKKSEGTNEELESIKRLLELMDHRIQQIESKMGLKTKKLSRHAVKIKELDTEFKGLKADQHTLIEKMNAIEKTAEERSKDTKEETEKIKSELKSIDDQIQQNELLLKQTTSNVEEMKLKIASMTQQQETVQYKKSEDLKLLKHETYKWIIKDVEKIIQEEIVIYKSEIFTFIGYKYYIQAKIEKKNGGLWIYLQFKDGDTINKSLNTNGFTGFKFIIRDQSNAQTEKNIVLKSYLKFDNCFGTYDWLFGRWLPKEMLSPPYTKDNCIKITILFEPPSIDRSFVSNNGVLKWRVDNYKKRKDEGWFYGIWSPSFYTSPQGYRVKTQLIISHSQRVEVAVYFLTGEHDDSLTIDFPHKTTVTLFNQLDPSKNMVEIKQHKDVGYYTIQLESSVKIEDNGFVKDDSILLKVVIEPVYNEMTPVCIPNE